MKTFKVRVDHLESATNQVFTVSLPDYYDSFILTRILNKQTKYDVFVTVIPDDSTSFSSVEEIVEAVKSVELYKEEEVLERDTIEEIKEVKLPSDMTVSLKHEFRDNSRHLTFFECDKVALPCITCPYAEEGINKYLIRDIGATISCIGRYYLVGDYELVKKSEKPVIKDGKNLDNYYLIKWNHKTSTKLVEI